MGADKGILVTDRVLGGADTWATSTTLAGAIRNLDYDLIITGRQAIDGDHRSVLDRRFPSIWVCRLSPTLRRLRSMGITSLFSVSLRTAIMC